MQRLRAFLLGCVILLATVAWVLLVEPAVRRAAGLAICAAAAFLGLAWIVMQGGH